jgi:GNAT superfamily N-acetyltransferase
VTLTPCTFDDIAPLAAGTHADGLIISWAMATHWFMDRYGAGFVGFNDAAHRVTLTALFVHPGKRGERHGTRLLDAVIAMAGRRDVDAVVEPPLHRWFGSFGFIAVHKTKKSAWLMCKPGPLSE